MSDNLRKTKCIFIFNVYLSWKKSYSHIKKHEMKWGKDDMNLEWNQFSFYLFNKKIINNLKTYKKKMQIYIYIYIEFMMLSYKGKSVLDNFKSLRKYLKIEGKTVIFSLDELDSNLFKANENWNSKILTISFSLYNIYIYIPPSPLYVETHQSFNVPIKRWSHRKMKG